MKKEKIFTVLIAAFFLFFATLTVQCTTKMQSDQAGAETGQTDKQPSPAMSAKTMKIIGKIAIGYNNMYKIRGKMPPEVFTILDANPQVLDEYVKTGKVVDIEVQVVSGDNIKIMTIDGQNYPKDSK